MARFGLSMFRRVRRFQFRCFARKRFGKQETKSFGRFLISGQSPADAVKSENTTAIDWRRESPLLQHVQLGDVVFMDQPGRAATAKDNAFANLAYEILAQGPRGPLIVERIDDDALLIALLFHTDRSTLPYRVGFPIFVSNVVQAALKQSGLAEAAAARTGALAPKLQRWSLGTRAGWFYAPLPNSV